MTPTKITFQLLHSQTGVRSEVITANNNEIAELLEHAVPADSMKEHYVLVLCTEEGCNPDNFMFSQCPLMHVDNFISFIRGVSNVSATV